MQVRRGLRLVLSLEEAWLAGGGVEYARAGSDFGHGERDMGVFRSDF
jgi:hypothetical protein